LGFRCTVSLDPLTPRHQRPWSGVREAVVSDLQKVADGVLQLTVQSPNGDKLPDYQPGQHVTYEVVAPDGHRLTRSYSLVGPASVTNRKHYQIAVRQPRGSTDQGEAAAGRMSGQLHRELAIGDTVFIGCPNGLFTMPEASNQPVVLIAGGIGITPFLSYLET